MKKILAIAFVATIGLASFSSCKKSSSSPSYSMKATAGTTSYNASNCIAASSGSLLIIEGIPSASSVVYPYIAITLTGWNGSTGTTSLDGTNGTGSYITSATSNSSSAYGTVTITSASSTTISGTYSFTCTDSTKISNGTFTAKKS